MKFIVSQTALLAALNMTGKCITGKTNVPIVDNYLFKIDCDELSITGTNLEIFLTKTIAIEGGDFEQAICVPKERLLALIGALPDESLLIRIDKKVPVDEPVYAIEIESSCGKYHLPVITGADYPALPEYGEVNLGIDSGVILEGVGKTLFACSNDELRPAMTGLYFQLSESKMIISATNARVLCTVSMAISDGDEIRFIVPARTMALMQGISAGPVTRLGIDDKGIVFRLDDNTVLRSRIIDEMYPAYRDIIPKSNNKILNVDRSRLMGALKRVGLFSDDSQHAVTFNIGEDGSLEILCENELEQTAKETLTGEYSGEAITILMDGSQLGKCLAKCDSEQVWMSFSKPTRAVLITNHEPDDSGENLMLIMPIAPVK